MLWSRVPSKLDKSITFNELHGRLLQMFCLIKKYPNIAHSIGNLHLIFFYLIEFHSKNWILYSNLVPTIIKGVFCDIVTYFPSTAELTEGLINF
jgi:hypothetical protein